MKIKLLFIFLFVKILCFSQDDFSIEEIKIEDGNQSYRSYNNILIDNDGFLWYTVHGGIVQYFGHQHIFHKLGPQQDKFKLTFGFVQSKKGLIYVSTDKGVFIFNPKTGESNKLNNIYDDKGNIVELKLLDGSKDSNIWFLGNNSKIYKYVDEKELYQFSIDFYLSKNILQEKLFISFFESEVYIIGASDVFMLKNHSKFSSVFKIKPVKSRTMFLTKNGSFFKAGTSGKHFINKKPFIYKYVPEINAQVVEIVGHNGGLQVAKNNIKIKNTTIDIIVNNTYFNTLEFYTFNKKTRSFKLISDISFSTKNSSIIIDKNRNIWVTNNGKIYNVLLKNKEFNNFLNAKKGERTGKTDANRWGLQQLGA